MPEALGLQDTDLHGQGQCFGAEWPQFGDGPPASAGGVDHGPVGLDQEHGGDEPDDHGQDVLGPAHRGPSARLAGWVAWLTRARSRLTGATPPQQSPRPPWGLLGSSQAARVAWASARAWP